jgi:hypothetical protein
MCASPRFGGFVCRCSDRGRDAGVSERLEAAGRQELLKDQNAESNGVWNYTGMCELCGGATRDFICLVCRKKVRATGSKYIKREDMWAW